MLESAEPHTDVINVRVLIGHPFALVTVQHLSIVIGDNIVTHRESFIVRNGKRA